MPWQQNCQKAHIGKVYFDAQKAHRPQKSVRFFFWNYTKKIASAAEVWYNKNAKNIDVSRLSAFFESVISMNKRFDAAHQILTGGQGVVSSSLATRTSKSPETAMVSGLSVFVLKLKVFRRSESVRNWHNVCEPNNRYASIYGE